VDDSEGGESPAIATSRAVRGALSPIVLDEGGLSRSCWPAPRSAATVSAATWSSASAGFSLIVTSNKPFSAWGEIFGDEVITTP
jgi:hypothetical protein